MKIALIAPAIKFICEYPPLNEVISQEISRGYRWPEFNLTLLTLAGLTPREEHEIHVFDEVYRPVDFETKFDVVAITAMTFNVLRAYDIAAKFREKGSFVVLGGIHATLLPQEVSQHVDAVFVGEAEETWPAFLKDFANRNAKKIYCGSQIDMAISPVPRWDLMDEFLTPEAREAFKVMKTWTVGINATRGCPRDCEYCSSTKVYGAKFRKKSISQVVQEVRAIKQATRQHGIDDFIIAFRDDNPILGVKYGMELAEALGREGVFWTALTDIAIYKHPELIEKLYPNGCINLGLGLESLDTSSLHSIAPWKSTQISHYEEFIDKAIHEGLLIGTNFIFGMDDDNDETFRLIDKFCSRWPILPNFLILTPFPNQPITQRLKKEGRLSEDIYWDRCNLFNLVFEPKQVSKEEIYQQLFYLHKKYNNLDHWVAVKNEVASLRRKKYQSSPMLRPAVEDYQPRANQSFVV